MPSRFADLHENTLVPMLRDAGIEPVLFLLTEVGPHHRFLDIYRYPSWDAYDERTARFLSDDRIGAYYDAVERCILGSIEIELAKEFSCTPGVANFLTGGTLASPRLCLMGAVRLRHAVQDAELCSALWPGSARPRPDRVPVRSVGDRFDLP